MYVLITFCFLNVGIHFCFGLSLSLCGPNTYTYLYLYISTVDRYVQCVIQYYQCSVKIQDIIHTRACMLFNLHLVITKMWYTTTNVWQYKIYIQYMHLHLVLSSSCHNQIVMSWLVDLCNWGVCNCPSYFFYKLQSFHCSWSIPYT